MPSDDLLLSFQDHFTADGHWVLDGTHYQKTADAWLENLDASKAEVMPALVETYGDDAERWYQRWRVFFLACSELWGYDEGREWWVSHYYLRRR